MSYNKSLGNSQSDDHCGTTVSYPVNLPGNDVVNNRNYDMRAAQTPSDCGNCFSSDETEKLPIEAKMSSEDK